MLYRTGHAAKGRTRSERVRKFFELTFKSLVMVVLPLGSAVVFGMVWYYVAYLQGLHFSPELENIAVSAWIPMFGIIYGLLATVACGLSRIYPMSGSQSMLTSIAQNTSRKFEEPIRGCLVGCCRLVGGLRLYWSLRYLQQERV